MIFGRGGKQPKIKLCNTLIDIFKENGEYKALIQTDNGIIEENFLAYLATGFEIRIKTQARNMIHPHIPESTQAMLWKTHDEPKENSFPEAPKAWPLLSYSSRNVKERDLLFSRCALFHPCCEGNSTITPKQVVMFIWIFRRSIREIMPRNWRRHKAGEMPPCGSPLTVIN